MNEVLIMTTQQGKILFNISFWLILWLFFFLSILQFEELQEALKISSIIIFPLILPVYIHDYVFDYFILRKKYVLYLFILTVLAVFFGYINSQVQFVLNLKGESNAYVTLLFFMLFYTGAKYARIGALQQMKLKEEESKRLKAEMELKEMEAKQASAELDLLKSQVNPHFLFNSLNSIYSLILDKSEIASDTVLELSDLMRYLLESSKKRKVLVKHEIKFLQNYIELEKIRLGKKANVEYKFINDYDGKIISPMLLIPFIENCFKHGISAISKDNEIVVSINLHNKILSLKTINNIAPKRISSYERKVKTGIENVKKRLQLLYPKRHELIINATDKQYLVSLKIEI